MSLELWTRHFYGHQFGQPENRLQEGLSEDEMAAELRRDHGLLLHKLLVIDGETKTLANKWLAAYEKDGK